MIRMYRLHAVWVDDISGIACIHRSFKFPDNKEIFDGKTEYGTREIAYQKITSEKKTWLLGSLESWLWHKKEIIEAGTDQARINTIKMCLDKLKEFHGQSLKTICGRIVKGQGVYESLLPSPNNPSHESSKADLEELIKFCQTETQKPQNV